MSQVAVAVPAHWRPSAVEALRGALGSKPGLARSPLVSDAEAALTALRSNPGLPTAGVIVLCDFGGSGASITVVDAAANDAPIGETVRVPDFSGDQVDQAILTDVVAGIFDASDADPAGTSMVGSLSVLRDECRRAKERLSDETATAIVIDVPGIETTVRMTRMELDHLIDEPLAEFLAALADTLDRNRIPLASISAVATIGGGARIPLITQRLSEHLRTTVVTTPQPQLTAAEGVALIAHRGQVVETATAMAPAAPATATVSAAAIGGGASAAVGGALAWSEVDDDPYDVLHTEPYVDDQPVSTPAASRPEVHFQHEEFQEQPESRRRSPAVLFALAGAAVAVGAMVFGLTAITRDTSTVPAGTSSSIAPAAPVAEPQAPAAQLPAPAQAPAAVAARPQPRVAPRQQAPVVVQQAPQHAAPAPAPAPAPEAPAPAPEPAPAPAPENPAPAPPTDPGTGTPPIDPGTGGGGTSTPPIDPGTGGGGTGTPPIDPGTGGGGSGTGTGGTGAEEKAPAKPGLIAPILEPILMPQP